MRIGYGTGKGTPGMDMFSSIIDKMHMEHGSKFLNSLTIDCLIAWWHDWMLEPACLDEPFPHLVLCHALHLEFLCIIIFLCRASHSSFFILHVIYFLYFCNVCFYVTPCIFCLRLTLRLSTWSEPGFASDLTTKKLSRCGRSPLPLFFVHALCACQAEICFGPHRKWVY
jgi:hypothetical protein